MCIRRVRVDNMLKAKGLLGVVSAVLLLVLFPLFGCNSADEAANNTNNEQTEIVLYLGVNEKSSVELEFLDETCVVDFNADVLELRNKTLFAKQEGTSIVSISSNNLEKPISKTVVVKKPEFCGDVWFNSVYTYCIVGHAKPIVPNNLNKNYSFDTKYYSKSPHFKIDDLGNIVPLSVGRGSLILSLASGVNELGELVYTNFSTTVNVVPESSVEVFVVNENGVAVEEKNGKYVFQTVPSGTSFGFKFVCDEGFFVPSCEVSVISQTNYCGKDNLINFNGEIVNNLQKFVLFDEGNVTFLLSANVCCYNHSKTIKTNNMNFDVYRKTTNITAKVSSVEFGNNIDGDNEFNVYAINENHKDKAKQDKVYSSVFVKFESNSKTDDLKVVVDDANGNVFPKGEGFVVKANRNGVVKFVVSSKHNDYKEEFVFNIRTSLAEGANFANLTSGNNVLCVGEIVDVQPILLPSYALASVNYVYNTSIFEINEGQLLAKDKGEAVLKIYVNEKEYVHSIKVVDAKVKIFCDINYNSGNYSAIIGYIVGEEGSTQDVNNYSQVVQVLVYDQNKNLIQLNQNILLIKEPNRILVELNRNYGCYVQICSEEYDVQSDLIWIQNY